MSDYKALYRKWRPRDFDDVSGQDSITDILKYEVANGKLSHAYLFCGSRGTGKTSCAKILAKAVNCLYSKDGNPCNECEACRSIDAGIATDVIEMDAASNNGVDDVRDMKDEIAFTPAALKYRVYIIDEVHMMSPSAFNALLKTLEEPPAYVVFILATTEFHKLPTTIVSRCQRFDFRRIATEDIIDRLSMIAKEEGIDLRPDGARVIARVSRGGMRDAVSLLELCAGSRKSIDAELVFDTVGSGNRDSAYKLIESILDSDYSAIYSTVNDIVMKSADVSVFWQEIIDSYRDIMVVKNTDRAKEFLDLTEAEYETLRPLAARFTPARLSYHISLLEGAMADMQRAFNSKRSIAEITLTRMCDAHASVSCEALALRVDELERELSLLKLGAVTVAQTNVNQRENLKTETKSKAEGEEETEDVSRETSPEQPYAKWASVLSRLRELRPSLHAQLASSECVVRSGGAFVVRMNAFFASTLASNESELAILKGAISEIEGVSSQSISLSVETQKKSAGGSVRDELISSLEKGF